MLRLITLYGSIAGLIVACSRQPRRDVMEVARPRRTAAVSPYQKLRERVLADFPGQRTVQLPQSLNFIAGEVLERTQAADTRAFPAHDSGARCGQPPLRHRALRLHSDAVPRYGIDAGRPRLHPPAQPRTCGLLCTNKDLQLAAHGLQVLWLAPRCGISRA
jgi:hypothetical protein